MRRPVELLANLIDKTPNRINSIIRYNRFNRNYQRSILGTKPYAVKTKGRRFQHRRASLVARMKCSNSQKAKMEKKFNHEHCWAAGGARFVGLARQAHAEYERSGEVQHHSSFIIIIN